MTTKRVLGMTTGLLLLGATMASAQAPATMGHHSMEGQVTKVDAKKGWVDVKTSEGSMKLHFPPAALASWRPRTRKASRTGSPTVRASRW